MLNIVNQPKGMVNERRHKVLKAGKNKDTAITEFG